MARKAPLRVVVDGEVPAGAPPVPARRLSLTEAAETGTTRDQLVALRVRVVQILDDPNCPPRDFAAVTRQYREIMKEIAAIDAQAKEEGDGAAVPDEAWTAV